MENSWYVQFPESPTLSLCVQLWITLGVFNSFHPSSPKVPRGCSIVFLIKIKQTESSPGSFRSGLRGTSSECSAAGIIPVEQLLAPHTLADQRMTFCCSGSLGSHRGVTGKGRGWAAMPFLWQVFMLLEGQWTMCSVLKLTLKAVFFYLQSSV